MLKGFLRKQRVTKSQCFTSYLKWKKKTINTPHSTTSKQLTNLAPSTLLEALLRGQKPSVVHLTNMNSCKPAALLLEYPKTAWSATANSARVGKSGFQSIKTSSSELFIFLATTPYLHLLAQHHFVVLGSFPHHVAGDFGLFPWPFHLHYEHHL